MFQEDEVQTLTELGLTPRQARVFLVLATTGESTARALTNLLKLARQDTYKVLEELQQIGLIEKHISNPTKFTAVPIQDACLFLLNLRRQETIDLQQKSDMLTKNFQRADAAKTVGIEEPKLLLIPKGEAYVLRIKKSIEKAQNNIDVISPRNTLQGLFQLTEVLQKATQRSVNIRFIVDDFEFVDQQLATVKNFMQAPQCRIKILPNHSSTRFCVYDQKEITVVVSSKASFSHSSLFWSDCPSIVESYQEYYEMLWLSAKDPNWNSDGKRAKDCRIINVQPI